MRERFAAAKNPYAFLFFLPPFFPLTLTDLYPPSFFRPSRHVGCDDRVRDHVRPRTHTDNMMSSRSGHALFTDSMKFERPLYVVLSLFLLIRTSTPAPQTKNVSTGICEQKYYTVSIIISSTLPTILYKYNNINYLQPNLSSRS